MATSRKSGAVLNCSRSWWHHLRMSLKKTMIVCVYFSKHLYFRYFCIFPSQIGGAEWHWVFKKKTQPNLPWKLSGLPWAQRNGLMRLLRMSWSVKEGPAGLDPTCRIHTRDPTYQPLATYQVSLQTTAAPTLRSDRQHGNWRGCLWPAWLGELFWEQIG